MDSLDCFFFQQKGTLIFRGQKFEKIEKNYSFLLSIALEQGDHWFEESLRQWEWLKEQSSINNFVRFSSVPMTGDPQQQRAN